MGECHEERCDRNNNWYPMIVVLFILLIIVGAGGYANQGCYNNVGGANYGGGYFC